MAKQTTPPSPDKAPGLPTHLDEIDVLKYEKCALQLQSLELQKQLVQNQMQALTNEWNTKYSLGPEDQIDLNTREIKRK